MSSNTSNLSNDAEIRQLTNGLTHIWMKDHRISVFSFRSTCDSTADCWQHSVIDQLSNSNQLIYFVHDFTRIKLSEYHMKKIKDLSIASTSYSGEVIFALPLGTHQSLRVDILRFFRDRNLKNWTVIGHMYSCYGAVDRIIEKIKSRK